MHTAIDMLTPSQTTMALQIDDRALLNMVNTGQLAAYNLGGSIRFKAADISGLSANAPSTSVRRYAALAS